MGQQQISTSPAGFIPNNPNAFARALFLSLSLHVDHIYIYSPFCDRNRRIVIAVRCRRRLVVVVVVLSFCCRRRWSMCDVTHYWWCEPPTQKQHRQTPTHGGVSLKHAEANDILCVGAVSHCRHAYVLCDVHKQCERMRRMSINLNRRWKKHLPHDFRCVCTLLGCTSPNNVHTHMSFMCCKGQMKCHILSILIAKRKRIYAIVKNQINHFYVTESNIILRTRMEEDGYTRALMMMTMMQLSPAKRTNVYKRSYVHMLGNHASDQVAYCIWAYLIVFIISWRSWGGGMLKRDFRSRAWMITVQ